MSKHLAVAVVLCLSVCLAGPARAEMRGVPFSPEELFRQSTLVFEGAVTEIETVEKYNNTFPVSAKVVTVLKGKADQKDPSFKHKNPGRSVIYEQEFNKPEVGQAGTFYLQDQGGTLVLIGYVRTVSPEAARAAVEAFLKKSGKPMDKSTIGVDQPELLKKTYRVTVTEARNDLSLHPQWKYLVLPDGAVEPLDAEHVVIAYRKEGIAVSDKLTMEAIAATIIKLADDLGPVIISRVDDIPGYKKHPLDSDFEAAVRPPWQFTDKDGNVYWVCTTYTRNQGAVRRYKFVFRRGQVGNPVDVVELGRGIGDATYPE